jgi:hypothetical protein
VFSWQVGKLPSNAPTALDVALQVLVKSPALCVKQALHVVAIFVPQLADEPLLYLVWVNAYAVALAGTAGTLHLFTVHTGVAFDHALLLWHVDFDPPLNV